MTMTLLAATLADFDLLAAELVAEVERTVSTRHTLSALPGAALLERAAIREAFNARLEALAGRAKRRLAELSHSLKASGLEGALVALAPAEAAALHLSVTRARQAAASLAEADARDAAVCTRLVDLVRAWTKRLPATGATYGRSGAPATATGTSTTSTRA